jgi:general stress protein YciG
MPGTKAGGLKAKQTNLQRHGDDFYKRIGSKGGQAGHTGGFATNRELAKEAGAKGGAKSRRGPAGVRKEKEYVWRPGDAMFSR